MVHQVLHQDLPMKVEMHHFHLLHHQQSNILHHQDQEILHLILDLGMLLEVGPLYHHYQLYLWK
jgi:hypothetical protein